MQLKRTILIVCTFAFAAGAHCHAEIIIWKGGGGNNHWENKENWRPRRVPGPKDDVVIPGEKGTIVITQDHAEFHGASLPMAKSVRSLFMQDSAGTPVGKWTWLTSAESHPDDASPLRHKPVNIAIVAERDINIGQHNQVFGANSQGNPAFGAPGANVFLTSVGGSIVMHSNSRIAAGDGARGPDPAGGFFPPGPGGTVELNAKKSVKVRGQVFGGSAQPFAGGNTAASGGTVTINAGDDVLIQKPFGYAGGGSTTEGAGGFVAIKAGKNLVVEANAIVTGGFSDNIGNHAGGALKLISGGLMTLVGNVTGGSGPVGAPLVISANDIDNTSEIVTGGASLRANTKGGDVSVTIKANPPTKLGAFAGGPGSLEGTDLLGNVFLNGKKIALADPIRGGAIFVHAVTGDGSPAQIAFLDGALLDAASLVCLDTGGGPIDFTGLSDSTPVISVDGDGSVILAGEPALDAKESLSEFIVGSYVESDIGCVPEGCLADINGDAVVDEWDLALLLAFWETAAFLTDLDGDGVVGAMDLSLLLVAWGPCS